jgi:RNA polymerase sigma factor (sigma-70 family)
MSLDGLTDKELLTRFIQDNDQDAFAQIVQRHGGMVFGICARLCITRDDAEDASQYVFITLASKAAELQSRTCLAGWLHRTAHHIARRRRRSADTRRRHEYQAGSLRPDFIQGEAGLDETADAIDDLQRALGALPEDYRNALILHHLEGHTIQEIAHLLETRPGTVAARLSRGRQMLRQRLVIMGVLLSTLDFDQILHDLTSQTDPPLTLRESTCCPPQVTAAHRAGMVAIGSGAAAPIAFSIKKTIVALVVLMSGTVAGGATYCAFKAPEPKPTVATRAPAPTPDLDIQSFSRVSSVPEPSTLSILVPTALLLLRRTRR